MRYYRTYISKDSNSNSKYSNKSNQSNQLSNNKIISNINSEHIRETPIKKANTQKIDNSDIPDEPEANPLAEKLEKLLDKAVKASLMGLFTANNISRELHLGRTWTYRDQPTGFCFSDESRQLFKALK